MPPGGDALQARRTPGIAISAHAIDLQDFAIRHAGLPDDKTLKTIEEQLSRDRAVASRDIDDVTGARIPSCGFCVSCKRRPTRPRSLRT